MGYIRAEEVTIPLRFLVLTAHFISILTIVFDLDAVVSGMTQVNPFNDKTSQAAKDEFDGVKKTVAGLTYAGLACFGVEYITLFLGVTIFFRPLMVTNIVAHFVGLILTILFYVDNWNLDSYIAFFTVFEACPMVLELLTLFFISKFSFVKY
mmetsp:Transcript_35506/g.78776  ORF Transcript_35506/g.78776 Transcript_35506/m.78776 type:complete len:152 (+) Transcript_35506:211-666(+)